MWYLRALAVAVVAVPMVVGTGCVTKQTYDRDIQVERDKTVKVMKERDQAKVDLKKANDTITDLTQNATDLAKVRQQLAAEMKRADGLQASIKTEVEKAKKMEAEKLGASTRAREAVLKELAAAQTQIVELKKEVEKLKKEMTAAPMAPPAAAPVTPPVAPR